MIRLLVLICVVLAAAGLGRMAFLEVAQFGLFKLMKVEFSCPETLDRSAILSNASLRQGESVFSHDLRRISAQILAAPRIKAVSVKRHLPSQISLEVEEDQLELLVKGDKLYGLTATQKLTDWQETDHIPPLVTGIDEKGSVSLSPSRTSYTDRVKLGYALALWKQLGALSASLAARLSEIHFLNQQGVELFFDPYGAVVVISLCNYKQSLPRLVLLEAQGMLNGQHRIDMTCGRLVVATGGQDGQG